MWTETYDEGEAKVTFTVQPPGDRDFLQAWGTAPEAVVLPVSWSLERPPVGEAVPLPPAAVMEAYEQLASLVRHVPRGAAPAGWELPLVPSFEAGQRFGPRTPIVLGRAAQLWSARDLGPLLRTLLPHAAEHSLTWPSALAVAAARRSGRVEAAREVKRAVPSLVDEVITRDGDRWGRALAALEPSYLTGDIADRRRIGENARMWLTQSAVTTLLAEVVLDAAGERVRLAGRGPWIAGFAGEALVPGPEWVADTRIVRAVRKILRPLDAEAWQELVVSYRHGRDDAESAYNDLCWRLTLLVHTSRCAIPWHKLKDLPAGRAWTDQIPQPFRRSTTWVGMEEWATCLAALLVHRARCSAEDVETFTDPVSQWLPDLATALNKPR